MDVLQHLIVGFRVALEPMNLLLCFLGCLGGTLVGVLPGFGPTPAMALLLPGTFHLSPVSAIIMLSGIYYGAMYGGSTTSILVNIPGETASVMTCLDGYQMASKGRAGPALGMAAFASFIAGTIGVIGLMLLAPPLARFALKFGPPEYFSLMLLGLTMVSYLSQGSMIKAFIMAGLGLLLSFIGTDVISGVSRFTFDFMELREGVGIIPVVMGVFGVGEILSNAEEEMGREVFAEKIKGLLPTREDWIQSKGVLLRGSLIGFFLGILPVGCISNAGDPGGHCGHVLRDDAGRPAGFDLFGGHRSGEQGLKSLLKEGMAAATPKRGQDEHRRSLCKAKAE